MFEPQKLVNVWALGKREKLRVLTNKHMLNFLRTNLFIYFNEEKACVLTEEAARYNCVGDLYSRI